MKLLVVASRFPFPLQKGDKLRLYHQIRCLSEVAEIYLYTTSTSDVKEKDIEELSKFCKAIKVHSMSQATMLGNITQSVLSSLPLQVGLFTTSKIKKEIEAFAKEHSIDHIYCQLARMAENIKDLPYPKTIDYMDAFGFGMKRRAEMGGLLKRFIYTLEAKRMSRYETEIFNYFDHHTIITDQDKTRMDLPAEKLTVVPNGVDTEYFKNRGGIMDYDIVFVGNMGYLPNIDAAKMLVKKILPKTNKKMNRNLSVLIAGARPSKEVIDLAKVEGVTIAGWMEDIRSAYKNGKIFVAPIFKGIGQQNKILEAMSMEIPCIVNSHVALGLGLEDGKNCLIADSEDAFVDKIIQLLEEPILYTNLLINGKELVLQKFVWSKQTQSLAHLIGATS